MPGDEYDLAAGVAAFQEAVRLHRLRQRKHVGDVRGQAAVGQQSGQDPGSLDGVGQQHPMKSHVRVQEGAQVELRRLDGGDLAAFSQRGQPRRDRGPAHQIGDCVDAALAGPAQVVGSLPVAVVQAGRRAQAAQPVVMFAPAYRHGRDAPQCGQLQQVGTDALAGKSVIATTRWPGARSPAPGPVDSTTPATS